VVLAYGKDADGPDRRRAPTFDVLDDGDLEAGSRRADDGPIEVGVTITNVVDGLHRRPVTFVPFADADADPSANRVWLVEEDRPPGPLGGRVLMGHEHLVAAGREPRRESHVPLVFWGGEPGAGHVDTHVVLRFVRKVSLRA
jgi:hypothetical protein